MEITAIDREEILLTKNNSKFKFLKILKGYFDHEIFLIAFFRKKFKRKLNLGKKLFNGRFNAPGLIISEGCQENVDQLGVIFLKEFSFFF